ncbi:MAG: 2-oxo acid dehydrogenase subunit E2 [Planctomycetes bacterium]|nr:2-oxo acid dehydrogenase subunit E2 [Planctomycetota bacterium]
MQNVVFKLPDLGEGVVEAEIITWHVKPGEEVRVDQPLVEVMTDKATVTIPSGLVGRVVSTRGSVGQTVAVGEELVVFDTSSPPVASSMPTTSAKTNTGGTAGGGYRDKIEEPSVAQPATVPMVPRSTSTGKVARLAPPLASPAVRRRARELHVDLKNLQGTGPFGRITHTDVDGHLRSEIATSGPRRPVGLLTTEIQMAGMRRQIAEKMMVSNTQIPHFTYVEEVDISELESLREHLNGRRTEEQPKLTYLPFIMLALTRALGRCPQFNAHYDDKREVITRYEAVHLGIATQTDRGLCVPVVRHAETMDLWQAAQEMRRLTEAARDKSISHHELTGSTFTVSSLGPIGGIAATPLINHPEVGILGVNKAVDRPVVYKGQIAIRRILHLSGSFDHRVIDGADGAIFIQRVKTYLEYPATIFI